MQSYEIIETEADVVRKIFNWYTVEGLSIGAIARQLRILINLNTDSDRTWTPKT